MKRRSEAPEPSDLGRVSPSELSNLHMLDGVGLESVEGLLEPCPVLMLTGGDVLLRAGQLNKRMYLVLSGRLRVHLDSLANEPVAFLEAGETVGELSVIDESPASAHVVADAPTRLLVVDEQTFWRMVNASHDFAINLLHLLAQRLRNNNSAYADKVRLQREYQRKATLDSLTGLYNRRWLDEALPRLLSRCLGDEQPLSVLILDVDHFKKLNDTYGHPVGDHILAVLARRLSQHLRPTDLAVRYGGEEFLVVLPETDLDGARFAAERLRRAMAESDWTTPDGRLLAAVTISLGGAQYDGSSDMAALIEEADAGLYRAKHAGRNRVGF